MKTAISLPDPLFEELEEFAEEHHLTRSGVIASAVKEYLDSNSRASVKARLKRVYSDEKSALDSELSQAQNSFLRKEEW